MRRAIAAAAAMGGLTLGGAVATPSLAATRTTTANTMKTVVYGGYEFQVPASWPVYRLDEHPQTCVRYDVHAVYLGQPGANMQCPAGLVGRTQTVSFIPGQGGAAAAAMSPGQPAGAGGTDLQRLAAVNGTVRQNAAARELSVALGGTSGATVVGTYGADPAAIEQVLSTLRAAPANSAPTAQTGSAPAQPGGGGLDPGTRRAELSSEPATATTQAAAKPTSTPTPAPKPVDGFDACTAPSLVAMHVWRSDYAAVGVYIGGENAACAYGNLSASWVKTVVGEGWGLLPTYVGPQSPCWGGTGAAINPASAAAEGKADGADAVSKAKALGIPVGSPIYYDMEGYRGAASCTTATLTFLGAWDRQVAAEGYVTGVYSSQDSGIADMQAAATGQAIGSAGIPGFTAPDAVWIALWDNKASLGDGNLLWPVTKQAKQYAGNVNASFGGITLNVDKDIVGGPVAR